MAPFGGGEDRGGVRPAPSGMTATPGTYRCVACGHEQLIERITNLPVCRECHGEYWQPVEGGVNVYGHPEQRKR